MRYIAWILVLVNFLTSLSLGELSKYPRSVEKDFFLYLFLRQDNISTKSANEAFYQFSKVKNKTFNTWAKHSNDKDIKQYRECKKTYKLDTIKNVDCLAIAFSIQRLFAYINDRKAMSSIYQKLSSNSDYSYEARLAFILMKRNLKRVLLKKENQKLFLDIFNSINNQTRLKYFNFYLDDSVIRSLSAYKYKFALMLKNTITNVELTRIQKSFLKIFADINFSNKSNFFLGLNALRLGNNKLSQYYLLQSLQMSKNIEHKNKSLFWLYKVTLDKSYLEQLSKSFYVDFYSTFALLKMGIVPDVVHKISINKTIKKPLFNVNNPFEYRKYLDGLNSSIAVDERLLHQDTIPHIIKQYNKFFKFKKNFFFTPKYISDLNEDNEQKAILLSIARQESGFIPSSMSSSFAGGVMQILPFVFEEIGERGAFKHNAWSTFDPKKSVEFANFHIKVLRKYLKHPLFVAYGYSNGLGFTKRLLKREYFKKGNIFEPYLSMELMPNNQARKYGKKVLGNYIIYRYLLGDNVDIDALLLNILR